MYEAIYTEQGQICSQRQQHLMSGCPLCRHAQSIKILTSLPTAALVIQGLVGLRIAHKSMQVCTVDRHKGLHIQLRHGIDQSRPCSLDRAFGIL